MLTIPQRLALAVQHQQSGRLDEAEALYHSILAEAPQHPHALHLLGVVAHQKGKHDEALERIYQALAAHGPHPVFHSNLAAVHLALDQLVEAEAHCRTALRLKSDLPDAHKNLSAILQRKGGRDEAARALREAQRASATSDEGNSSAPSKRAQAFAQLYEAVRHRPADPQAHRNLGVLLI